MFSLIISDSGVCTSSEEETAPPDDGPFAFRRKPGCYYEMVSLYYFCFLFLKETLAVLLPISRNQATDKQYKHFIHKEINFHIKRRRAVNCF